MSTHEQQTNELWRPVGKAIARIASTKPTQPQTVLILGAGMAGLGAAYELAKHPGVAHVHIVEGRQHSSTHGGVGGRIMTHRFGPAPGPGEEDTRPYHELGAMRIPHVTHDYTWHYVRELGLRRRPFVNDVQGFYEVGGKKYRNDVEGRKQLAKEFELVGDEAKIVERHGPGGLLTHAMTPLMQRLDPQCRKQLVNGDLGSRFLRWLDAQTILGYLADGLPAGVAGDPIPPPLTPSARALLSAATALESRWHWSLAADLRGSLTNAPPKDEPWLWEIEGGLDLLPRGLYEKLAKNPKVTVHFGTEVTRIAVKEDGTVEVGLQRSGESVVPPKFDRVICTLPFPVLRQLELEGLGADKLRAIHNMQLCSSTKVLLHCKERFWERQGIRGGSSVTDRAPRQMYYPSDFGAAQECPVPTETMGVAMAAADPGEAAEYWNVNNPTGTPVQPELDAAWVADRASRPGVLLGSYTWSDPARQVGRLDAEKDVPGVADASDDARPPGSRRDRIVKDLAHIHPELRDEGMVVESASIYWDRFKWSKGAFGITPPGDLTDYYQAGRRSEGRLFFAGEHISIAPGWIQGALESGLAAAYELLKQASDEWSGLVRHHVDLAAPLMFIRGSKGVLACGYFAVATFDATGEAGVVVRGVKTFEDMLKTVIRDGDVSKGALDLGVRAGMTGREALEKLR